MIVSIAAHRLGMTVAQREVLRALLAGLEVSELVHGGEQGGDESAHVEAVRAGVRTAMVPLEGSHCGGGMYVDDRRDALPAYGRAEAIATAGDLLVALPRRHHEEPTAPVWTSVRFARRLRRPHVVVWPDGMVSVQGGRARPLSSAVASISGLTSPGRSRS